MDSAKLNGVKTHAPNSKEELMLYAIENNMILVAVNAQKILNATPQSREIINRNLGYPDGVGAIWLLKKKCLKAVKIPGCELWLDLISNYYKTKTFYLVGGTQKIIDQTVKQLQNTFKGIQIFNYRNGYIQNNQENLDLINDIVTKKPDVVFVAMGSPKQELLMEEIQKQHKALYQGLGGSFDVYTGNVKRAPKWWINQNLEWAYRLLKEPSRIKSQIHLIRFIINTKLNRY